MNGAKTKAEKVEQTKARILGAALSLFNEQGTAAVTTNHIAKEAGISVGNLYYHFSSREEIVRELFKLNAEETLVAFALEPGTLPNLGTIERFLTVNYEILWRYRFLYRELNALLIKDPELHVSFISHREHGFSNFGHLLKALAAFNFIRLPETAEKVNQLAEAVWLVSEFYIPFLESHPGGLPENFIQKGVELLKMILEPYVVSGEQTGGPM